MNITYTLTEAGLTLEEAYLQSAVQKTTHQQLPLILQILIQAPEELQNLLSWLSQIQKFMVGNKSYKISLMFAIDQRILPY